MNHKIANSFFVAIAVAAFLVACSTVPMTGRKQLTLLPQSQLMRMSLDSYQQVLREEQLSQDREKVEMVRRAGQNLARAAEQYLRDNGLSTDQYAWEFNLIQNDDTINAWCMPGGKVAVYTGILPITRDETGLAVVMGHEIAHAIANHGNERMSQSMAVQLGSVALSEALSKQPEKTRNIFLSSYGVATQVGAMLPYSRLHEREADTIGLNLMAMAGYDPRQAIPFWQRMAAQGGGRPPEFLSTHPGPESRMENLRQHLPKAMELYRKNS
jgi:predicted Zn-dependent protease